MRMASRVLCRRKGKERMLPLELQHSLSRIKCLGVASRCPRFDTTNPHEREEGLRREPVLVLLALEALHEHADLPVTGCFVKVNEDVGGAQIAIVLENLVFENELTPK